MFSHLRISQQFFNALTELSLVLMADVERALNENNEIVGVVNHIVCVCVCVCPCQWSAQSIIDKNHLEVHYYTLTCKARNIKCIQVLGQRVFKA